MQFSFSHSTLHWLRLYDWNSWWKKRRIPETAAPRRIVESSVSLHRNAVPARWRENHVPQKKQRVLPPEPAKRICPPQTKRLKKRPHVLLPPRHALEKNPSPRPSKPRTNPSNRKSGKGAQWNHEDFSILILNLTQCSNVIFIVIRSNIRSRSSKSEHL